MEKFKKYRKIKIKEGCVMLLPIENTGGFSSCLFSIRLYTLPRWLSGKEFACQSRSHRRHGFSPWAGKIPWRRKWQPTPVFLPGQSHEQRSLSGYSPWGSKELDMTEQLSIYFI